MLEVLATGPLATVQDRGRVGFAHLGVPRSGALDWAALDLANRLVGNDVDAVSAAGFAGLELGFGGLWARFSRPAVVAVTGAPAPVWADGRPAGFGVPVWVRGELRIGAPTAGSYTYVAVQGGIEVPPTLGSRSTDTLSGLGPAPLRSGDRLRLGAPEGEAAPVDFTPGESHGDTIRVRVRFGPRDDWFTDPSQLLDEYRIGASNRIGARLTGRALARAVDGELASEGLVSGAIQVPGDGRPIVFLADHPTTGGYPVIAVVHPADLALIAQARAGSKVVFCGP